MMTTTCAGDGNLSASTADFCPVNNMAAKFPHTWSGLYQYIVVDFWEIYGDPLAKNVPLCGDGPWKIAGLVSIYLSFVFYFGPKMMKNRPAYKLEKTIRYYDWLHVVANGVCSIFAIYMTRGTLDCWGCKQTGSIDNFWDATNLYLGGAYFACKFFDLMDTVFFILRKKDRQVSTLHVCHHAVMPFAAYSAIKFAPLGRTAFVGIINSLIHTVMYFYYALASYGPSMAKYLWWKKYITTLQMIQFIAIILHSIQGAFFIPCNFPIGISILEFLHGFFFLRSFWAFFKNEYTPIKTKPNLAQCNQLNVIRKLNGGDCLTNGKQHFKGA